MTRKITVALAGNPNSGKTTIFNQLTGERQHVGNYPGVTVEKVEGSLRHGDLEINVVDLPGTYSLTAYSIEEMVARNFLLDEKPDVVVDILDASNLERNLYLATQFMELGAPLVFALNMSDLARSRGIEFDLARLSGLLGAPIVPTVGHKGTGISELVESIVSVAVNGNGSHRVEINYGKEIAEEIGKVQTIVERQDLIQEKYDPRWFSIKLLEHDKEVMEQVGSQEVLSAVSESSGRLEEVLGDSPEILIADRRYGFISGACQEAVQSTVEARHNLSDRIDAVMTNRLLGLPIFLGLMYMVFHLTFTLGDPPMGWIESLFEWMGRAVTGLWPAGSESALKSLLVDGIIGGVGGVIVFLPNIVLLFLAIAILEDTGYMARAAFVVDGLMHRIGLHGKSFIPMLIGFGCSVPAIMATRTLESRRDRLTTMLITPLMSCGARLPIYALIIPAFFPQAWQAPMLWTIYMIGILLAVGSAKLLRATIFKGESTPFVMELPPYRLPTLRGIWFHMWERTSAFVRKAWTIIMITSILIWVLLAIPVGGEGSFADTEVTDSAFASASGAVAPILKPLGFGDWQASGALVSGFVAKEVVVGTMAQVYEVEEAEEETEPTTFFEDVGEVVTSFVGATVDTIKSIPLIVGINLFEEEEEEEPTDLMVAVQEGFEASSGGHGALASVAFMVFVLIYIPCMVAVAAERQELGNKWTMVSIVGQTVLAWLMAFVVFQGGKLLGLG